MRESLLVLAACLVGAIVLVQASDPWARKREPNAGRAARLGDPSHLRAGRSLGGDGLRHSNAPTCSEPRDTVHGAVLDHETLRRQGERK